MTEEPEQIRLLKEILKWTRFSAMPGVQVALNDTLDSEQKKLIYDLSNGQRGSVEIAQAAKVSDWTVRNYWRIWASKGLVEPLKAGRGDRFKASFSLEDFGITSPKIGKPADANQSPSPTLLDESQQSTGIQS